MPCRDVLEADAYNLAFAWPTAQIAVVGGEPAVRVLYRNDCRTHQIRKRAYTSWSSITGINSSIRIVPPTWAGSTK